MGRSAGTATTAGVEAAPAARRLLVMGPAGFITRALPERGQLVIGRSDGADVPLDDPQASRRHAVLRLGAGLEIEDLGSANGTRVRQRRLAPGRPAALVPGEGVQIGQTVLMVLGGASAPAETGRVDTSAGNRGASTPAETRSVRSSRSDVGGSPSRSRPGSFAGAGAPMRELLALAERAARGRSSVVLLGETGVGKEVLARFIHARSPRARAPLVAINCAALSDALFESELFGHTRGAFTGATTDKPGLLEAADGGTVFLDEIGELPLLLQAKLLRVVERGEVQRVGSLLPRRLDLRFVAATNRDLDADVAAGRFRRDLFFRLAGFCLTIPPLRERRGEVAGLAARFLTEASRASGRPVPPRLAVEAHAGLLAHAWPGNVRELRQVIDRAVTLCDGDTILPDHLRLDGVKTGHLPDVAVAPRDGVSRMSGRSAASAPDDGSRTSRPALSPGPSDERTRILAALAAHAGNQSRAAVALGMSRKTLLRRLEAWGAPRPRKAPSR